MKTAIYAGTFDPITNGHLSVLNSAARLFDKVIVGVAADNNKKEFSGLLVDFAKEQNASALVRGLRVVSDFEYEMQMAMFNKDLNGELETVFFIADAEHSFISSSQVRNIASLGGSIDKYVSKPVADALKAKYGQKNAE